MSDNGEVPLLSPQAVEECGECHTFLNISSFCKNCVTSLCDGCAAVHRTTILYKSHTVIPRSYSNTLLFGPTKIVEQCKLHPGKKMTMYCDQCNIPCCASCLVRDHHGHKIDTIEHKYNETAIYLNDYQSELKNCIRPMLDNINENARKRVKEDNYRVEEVIDDINNFRTTVIQTFNRGCDNLITEVLKISHEGIENLRQVENSIEKLESLQREIEEIIKQRKIDIVNYAPPKLESLFPKLKSANRIVPSFLPSKKVLDVIKNAVGSIHMKETNSKGGVSNSCLNLIRFQKVNSFRSTIGIGSIRKTRNNMVWVMSIESPTLYMYNDTGNVVKSVTLTDVTGIRDMAVTRSGDMILTCRDNTVRRLSVNGNLSFLINVAPSFECHGVCLTEKEEIVVCMRNQNDTNHIAVFSNDGHKMLRDIPGRDMRTQVLSSPYRVLQNGKDLCVVNIGTNVVCLEQKGDVKWVYDGKQAKFDKTCYPRGITSDKHMNLLVADKNNNCVHYIDNTGGLIQVVLTQGQTGLIRPLEICWDDVSGLVWMVLSCRPIFITNIEDKGSSSIPPQTFVEFVECGLCQGNANISWFCKDCPTSLCDACATTHRTIEQYKSHTIVERTYTVLRLFGPAKIAEQCEVHPEKDISSYCNKCDVPCCISCLVQNHQRHEIFTIEDKYIDAKKRLNVYYKDVRPTVDKLEDQAKADVTEDTFRVKKVINDINEFRKDFIQNVNRSCDDLITEVNQIPKKTTEAFGGIEKSKEIIESLITEIEEKIERGKYDIIKYQPPKLESLIPSMKRLEVMKESVGEIKSIVIEREEKDISKMLRYIHVEKLHSFDSKIDTTSMTTAGNNMAWIMGYKTPTMYLCNDKGKVVRSVKVKGSEGINDMAITQSGEMIVTCTDSKVRRVSVNGKVSTMIDAAPFGCYGVCVTDKQEILVCMRDQGDKNHAAVYSSDGRSKLREIRGRDGQGKHLITYPYRVVQNGQDLCVVNGESNVVCVDERDNVRWVYDGKQAKLKGSFDPSGICVDKYNNLLVTDMNNDCVHYIDREGGLIQVILTQEQTGLLFHWGICVDDVTGHVWVGNIVNKVATAKYLR
ncbi:hypothetical protein FSP39_024673 [Pinctada imbricata]|uniref:B box-type domain-containing protein n=1 Tax=Pinctada imbricata TaxID=66713 RepID=A0AA89BPA3_PINIB|nr:hypothetical protein FSP39_024673 [Pinctada imbricata]